ncbi:MAG: hypothetical protein JXD21_07340 [Candidatus Omnitrophica bacterium]|nr:hypothetical protein [Candidatus Omnitrophota bacterium]
MKFALLLLLLFLFGQPAGAQNKAYLKDGKIVVETPEGARQLDYSADKDETRYEVTSPAGKSWSVQSDTKKVDEALGVYMEKGTPLYEKNVIITDEADGTQTIHVDYITKNENETMLFSPDGNYAYYLTTAEDGKNSIYGINLLTNKTFFISTASDYRLITCTNDRTYLALRAGINSTLFMIYDLSGTKMGSVESTDGFSGIQNDFCFSL